jgi:hypothetical protein
MPACFRLASAKLNRAVQVAGVGEGHGGQAVLLWASFTIAAGESVESRNE